MYTKSSVNFLCFYLAISAAAVLAQPNPDLDFRKFMIQSRDLSQGNPARSLDCFDYYLPLLNGIVATYEEEYKECLDAADNKKNSIDDSTQKDREEIEASAENACSLLNTCSSLKDSISYFGCYANAGSENSMSMFTISANAGEVLADVKEQYVIIDNDQYRCTNASERRYVENTADTYDQLSKCLAGAGVPSTTSPAPTTTTTPEPTTTTPESTPESSSEAPSTESSSEAPSTESSSEAPSTESSSEVPSTESSSEATSTQESSSESTEEAHSDEARTPEEDLSPYRQNLRKFFEKFQQRRKH